MKQFVCEMCGGHDLVKEGDLYVCQSCGCKYSAESAKTMFVEVSGTVEVTGNVSVNRSNEIENYFIRARQLLQDGDYDSAEIYYNKILDIDATHKEVQEGLQQCKKIIVEPNLHIIRVTPKPFGDARTILSINGEKQNSLKIDKNCSITLPVGTYKIKFYRGVVASKEVVINIQNRQDNYTLLFNPVAFSIKTELKRNY